MKKQVERSGPFKDYIAEALRVGKHVFISGQVGLDEEGNLAGEDMSSQVKKAYENVRVVLSKFDLSMDHIADETWFVTNMKHTMDNIEDLFDIRRESFGKLPETAQTLVEVKSLVMPELLIEIKCIAIAE